ncbi:MAG: hypothetical protein EAZ57_09630 [Cytophagales bacterium]|nr:MAG: hypothetical protein EAZ67_01340 [Cytophagales bacterium]TAF59898.1 MAG: hypothetical protein EAZ57_09630 [Cytophagales bacterium]
MNYSPNDLKIIEGLSAFMPLAAVKKAFELMKHYKLHVKVVAPRKNVLGQFAVRSGRERPVLSINSDLNPYQFLITFIHEVAHFTVWQIHGFRVKPHGTEWKQEYSRLLNPFLCTSIFPLDVLYALEKSLKEIKASSCSDPELYKVISRYDKPQEGRNTQLVALEQIAFDDYFVFQDIVYQKKKHLRTYCECVQITTKRLYKIRLSVMVSPHILDKDYVF